jgi:hypothetical protein
MSPRVQLPVDPYCTSAYLALRYVPEPGRGFCPGVVPCLPELPAHALTKVVTADEIARALTQQLSGCDPDATGLLLSGGIDSAILAALLPKGVRSYTIRFVAPGAVDETERAALFAQRAGLRHHVVEVTWQDYARYTDMLMRHKRAPLHAIEVALHKAAQTARADGVQTLVVGNGADSNFGGMDKLLSRDWSFDAFVERYTFVDPALVLAAPRSLRPVFEPYRRGEGFDVVRFLSEVHGPGIVQAFDNALLSASCTVLAPYETLRLAGPLDLARIRRGEPKYLLTELFERLYPALPAPAKIPFARPMDQWLADWSGPNRAELPGREAVRAMTGDQRWLVYCLERFLDLLARDPTLSEASASSVAP